MIKIVNKRKGGSLFHYAHFFCDCLFPEVVNGIYKYEEVIREKSMWQTLGNFSKIYTEVMKVKNTEVENFDEIKLETITYPNKDHYEKKHYELFRQYIFSIYTIKENYPRHILIKRGERINLIDNEKLSKLNGNVTTGKERREIKDIDIIEKELEKYEFKSLYFENLPFEEQINYFYNAKIIVCAHGAVMSNMFFCKEGTNIIEVHCNTKWFFFDTISTMLNLNHIKCTSEEVVSKVLSILE